MYPFFGLKPVLLLYAFRFFDPIRRRWVRARYVAERHEIEVRYVQWEIIGPPEIRAGGYAAMFSPSGSLPPLPRRAHLPPVDEPPPDDNPPEHEPPENEPPDPPVKEPPEEELVLNEIERFLVLLFLRRYVTWCARSRRFAQLHGAAALFARVRAE